MSTLVVGREEREREVGFRYGSMERGHFHGAGVLVRGQHDSVSSLGVTSGVSSHSHVYYISNKHWLVTATGIYYRAWFRFCTMNTDAFSFSLFFSWLMRESSSHLKVCLALDG